MMKPVFKAFTFLFVLAFSVFSLGLINSHFVAAQNQTTGIVIQGNEKTSVTQQVASRIDRSWPWYLTRASGIVASISLFWLMLSGIGQVTGHTFRFLQPITAWATHKALGIAFLAAVVVHIGALLFDKFVSFSIVDLLVPFASDHRQVTIAGRNFGSLYVALGIFSLYMTIVIVASSLLVMDKKPRFWKLSHLLSYLVMGLVFVHALFLGTDTSKGWVRIIWIMTGVVIVIATIARLRRANTI